MTAAYNIRLQPSSLFVLIWGMETQAMSEHSLTFPEPPRRRPPEMRVALVTRSQTPPTSEVREACLVGGFALAIFWVIAELAIALGMR